MAKRASKREKWPVPDSVEKAEALYREAGRELSEAVATERRLADRLVKNRDRRGRPLTERGRRQLVSRLESAIMRSACIVYTEREAFQLLKNQEANALAEATWARPRGRRAA